MTFVDAIRIIKPEDGKMFLKDWNESSWAKDDFLYIDNKGVLVYSSRGKDSCFAYILDQDEIESLDWEVI